MTQGYIYCEVLAIKSSLLTNSPNPDPLLVLLIPRLCPAAASLRIARSEHNDDPPNLPRVIEVNAPPAICHCPQRDEAWCLPWASPSGRPSGCCSGVGTVLQPFNPWRRGRAQALGSSTSRLCCCSCAGADDTVRCPAPAWRCWEHKEVWKLPHPDICLRPSRSLVVIYRLGLLEWLRNGIQTLTLGRTPYGYHKVSIFQ